jgi:hypothetical protein
MANYDLPQDGQVLARTMVRVAPAPWQAPYPVAAIRLSDGLVVYAHFADGRVTAGTLVTLEALPVTRADGEALTYGFRPTTESVAKAPETASEVALEKVPGIRPLAAPVFLAGVGMIPYGIFYYRFTSERL